MAYKLNNTRASACKRVLRLLPPAFQSPSTKSGPAPPAQTLAWCCNYTRCRLRGRTDLTPAKSPEISDRCATEAQRNGKMLIYSSVVLSRALR